MTVSDHAHGHEMRAFRLSRSDILTTGAGARTHQGAYTAESARENRKWCTRQRSEGASLPQS